MQRLIRVLSILALVLCGIAVAWGGQQIPGNPQAVKVDFTTGGTAHLWVDSGTITQGSIVYVWTLFDPQEPELGGTYISENGGTWSFVDRNGWWEGIFMPPPPPGTPGPMPPCSGPVSADN